MEKKFSELPKIGDTYEKRVVLQVDEPRYANAKDAAGHAAAAIQSVVKEFADLGTGDLATDQIRHVIGLDSAESVRRYIREILIERAEVIKIGSLTISPDFIVNFIVNGIAVGEVEELLRANELARRAVYAARPEFNAGSFEIVDGIVKVRQSAMKAALESCLILGNTEETKQVLAFAQRLLEIQVELNKVFQVPGSYRINLDDLITADGSGRLVVDGNAILRRSGEADIIMRNAGFR